MSGDALFLSESLDEHGSWHTIAMARRSVHDWLMSIKPEDLTPNAWLKRAGVNRSFFLDLQKGTVPRDGTLEKVLKVAGYSISQFDELRGSETYRPTSRKRELPFRGTTEPFDVPLMGTAQASDMEVSDDGGIVFVERMDLHLAETIDNLRRPPALSSRRDVYAISVVGESMSPAFRDGDPLYVDPKRQPHGDDYVVVQLKRPLGEDEGDQLHIALLKQLVRRTSSYIELRQFNPAATFRIATRDLHAVHRVIPWRELVLF